MQSLPAVPNRGDTNWDTSYVTPALNTLNTNKMDTGFALSPIVGSSVAPYGVVTLTPAVPVLGSVNLYPFYVGGPGWTSDAALVNCTTAFTGGTSPVLNVGLYADNGYGYPLLTSLLRTATVSLASLTTGIKTMTWMSGSTATPIALASGQYWIGVLKSGSADTTAGQFAALNAAAWQIPGANVGTVGRTYAISASALPTTAQSLTQSSVTTVPIVNLRRSA